MTENQWTTGPWKWHWSFENELATGSVYSEQRPGHAYAVAMCPRYQSKEQWAADASLIAAAPEMAEALARVLLGAYATWMAARAGFEGAKTSHDLFEKKPDVIAARAALAKARGEP